MPPVPLFELQPKLYLSLACVLSAVPCFILGRKDRSGPGGLLSTATILFAVGLPALLFKEFLPRPAVVIVGNMLVLGAMSLLWHTTAALCGRAPPRWTRGVAPALWAAFWLLPWFRAHLDGRIAIAATLTGSLAVLAVIELCRTRPKLLAQRLLIAVGVLHVTISVLRVVLAVRHDPFGASSLWTTITQLNVLNYVVLWPALCLVLLNQRTVELGLRDELSGVLNRRGLHLRAAGAPAVSVLLFDIDRFKRINDTFGHSHGDTAIVTFAGVASSVLGFAVPFGRIGGEEFVALVSDGGNGRAERLAEAVRHAFAATTLPCGIGMTVSVGVAHPRPGERDVLGAQLARADSALYRAKQTGRDKVEVWTEQEAVAPFPLSSNRHGVRHTITLVS
ncbi:GGDEF domain-containing protein [Rhizosaccharibacter radicis]|uniref:diguanylate cyclase n=1 Tax=Rhizosaccharibacter radicis TaxID=2782605 RepID=A0ABT1W0P0_9PROT|nr:GGDEF domain-containing protein [Acetobacteraceae bacterium KSS12]